MKCVIPGVNIKIFGRAIHSLSKIGDELYIDPLEQGLALRTVNSSRSAYAFFSFSRSFFQFYDGKDKNIKQDGDDDSLRCKLAMKSCLTVFKSLSSIEKLVERCTINIDEEESRIVFKMHCRHGIVKTHNLAFIECETLQAVFSKDNSANILTAQARLLCDAIVNFPTSQEEITLLTRTDKISLKNYVDDEPDPNKVMHTELTLLPEEFDVYDTGLESDITFCLKEFRAIMSFSEATNIPLSLNYSSPGRPVVFCIDSDSTFEANFVLATLADVAGSQVPSSQASQSQVGSQRKKTSTACRNPSIQNKSNRNRSNLSNNGDASSSGNSSYRHNQVEDTSHRNLTAEGDSSCVSPEIKRTAQSDKFSAVYDTLVDVQSTPSSSRMPFDDTSDRTETRDSYCPKAVLSEDNSKSPIIPMQDTTCVAIQPIDVTVMDDLEEDEDFVPGTPPRKRFCSMFFGSSQLSTQSQAEKTQRTVLAADTDDEDD